MAAVLAPVAGQPVPAVGHVPLRSEVGSLTVNRPGSGRGMAARYGIIWPVSLQSLRQHPRHSFIFVSSFCCQKELLYTGMINVLSHPQLMDLIEQAEVAK